MDRLVSGGRAWSVGLLSSQTHDFAELSGDWSRPVFVRDHSPHIEGGGDLIWQIGIGYFGCPPGHREFSTPIGLLEFIANLRKLSGGKPFGFKLCVGKPREFLAVCKAMAVTGITADFITVDGMCCIGRRQQRPSTTASYTSF